MNNIDKMKDDIDENIQKSKDQMKQSSKDWFNYIQEHPLQSMVFGISIFLAIKGMMKD